MVDHVDKLNWTFLDHEFYSYLKNMSCLTVMKLPYNRRCMMARQVLDCQTIINLFNYFKMMYCAFHISDKFTEISIMVLFCLLVIAFLLLMTLTIDVFFAPAMKIISMKLHMNEYLAGVTLLAFGNTCPDLIANLMPIRADAPIFTITVGNSLVIMLLSGGMVCFLKPFKMNGPSTIRDLLFLLLSLVMLRSIIFSEGNVSVKESVVLVCIYLTYLIINILDLLLLRYTIKKLRRDIYELRASPDSQREMAEKKRLLQELERDDELNINDTKQLVRAQSETLEKGYFFSTPKKRIRPEVVNHIETRTILHDERNPKNLFLITEFFQSLNPIDREEWVLAGWCQRFIQIARSPLYFILILFVPVVDYEKDKHGWSKLLNCTQIITNPFIMITLVHSSASSLYYAWYIIPDLSISKWSPFVTVPLATFVLFHSRTDVPPFYHIMFIAFSFTSSIVIIWVCASEMEVLTSIVGIVFNLSGNFMAITFGSVANAMADIIANSNLALQGYEKMAFAAIIGGPVFSIVVTMGTSFIFNEKVRTSGAAFWLYGEHGDNCYIFLMITILATLWWCMTFNFYARRSAGIFMWLMFLIFIIYCIGVEWDVVHEFSKDQYFNPK
ncbi:mitochondrial sodium/calcium exchanger protein [Drosophila guanche]|uniref:Blast:Sodium/potassium/calcium exchanger 6, mitochondrial n=1 Tax=Drosophila guanche TaxID=7266 RepID=A0A3B0JT58_DROGU|nr:mitochondrial sodium/calcium exchanger protein [Drosophila guanche]SPP74318.1 blast:Sodium/potassium/calcium exchanger 6%2C mitochondrial [Drosophila guanche]